VVRERSKIASELRVQSLGPFIRKIKEKNMAIANILSRLDVARLTGIRVSSLPLLYSSLLNDDSRASFVYTELDAFFVYFNEFDACTFAYLIIMHYNYAFYIIPLVS